MSPYEVIALDVISDKMDLINSKQSPIGDKEIQYFLANRNLSLTATLDTELALKDRDFVIIATPTNYDDVKNYFNTDSVETAIEEVLEFSPNAMIVIKSTIPVGLWKKCVLNIMLITLYFHQNFYEKVEHCMTIFIHLALLWVSNLSVPHNLLSYY